ncbi:MAG: cytochrome d ubiquinol oxidase subunit II [Hyphomicrobiaceae bacterium]|nr:cytochrome d ubiquinol oxidase subunit II [Hyphomicrobiaceae bacterium]
MDQITFWLPVVWIGILAIAIALYIILDGFDLGIGILFPFGNTEEERDQMMNSIAPFWDGNETWLILGGGGLWIAFPQAFAIIMPALYIPIILMLLALVFRGVAFEFRFVSKPKHHYWDWAFFGGSLVATISQGFVLGGLIQGIETDGKTFTGHAFDWFSAFSILCAGGLVIGYSLLGACWLMLKTEGPVAERARQHALPLLCGMILFIVAVSIWTPLQEEHIFLRWFTYPNILFLAPVPVLTALVTYWGYRSIKSGGELSPFFATIALFMLSYSGLAISKFPFIVPPAQPGGGLDLWDTAAAPESQIFMLLGVLVLLPITLSYTVLSYWSFRGKVKPGEGYH